MKIFIIMGLPRHFVPRNDKSILSYCHTPFGRSHDTFILKIDKKILLVCGVIRTVPVSGLFFRGDIFAFLSRSLRGCKNIPG
jgi:hypothetical protein